MKTLILLFLISFNALANNEKSILWSIKVNISLYNDSIYNLSRVIEKDTKDLGKECYLIGKISEGYQLKRAYTNNYDLRKINPKLSKYVYDILFNYVEKRNNTLKGYCFKSNANNQVRLHDRSDLLKQLKEIRLDTDKLYDIIQERVEEL